MLEILENIMLEEADTEEIYKEYEYDFENKRLTGKIAEGADAVKIWVFFALSTARYRFRAFSDNYGAEFEDMLGKNYSIDYNVSEIQRMITECLLVHPDITEVENFDFSFSGSMLKISFELNTKYGEQFVEFEGAGDF